MLVKETEEKWKRTENYGAAQQQHANRNLICFYCYSRQWVCMWRKIAIEPARAKYGSYKARTHTHTHHTMVIGQHTPHCSMWGNVERVLPSTSIKLWTTFAFHRSHISCEAVSIFHFGPNPAKDLCGSCTRRDLVLMWFRVGCSASKQIITMRAAAAINSLAIDFSDSALSSELRSTYFKYKRI